MAVSRPRRVSDQVEIAVPPEKGSLHNEWFVKEHSRDRRDDDDVRRTGAMVVNGQWVSGQIGRAYRILRAEGELDR